MNEVYEDPLAKLEAVLLEWDHSYTESRRQVVSRLQNAKARLELAWSRAESAKEANDRAVAGAVSAAEQHAERIILAEALEKSRSQVSALEQSLERAYERIRSVESDRTELLLRNDEFKSAKSELSAKNAKLQEQIEHLESSLLGLQNELTSAKRLQFSNAAQEPVVDPLFDGVDAPDDGRTPDTSLDRKRLEARIHEIQEDSARAHDTLTQRLAEALRDRDEAHQQIVQLRAEVEALRFSGASAFGIDPSAVALPAFELGDPAFTRLRLGQMLQRSGIVTEAQIATALEAKRKTPQKPLGAILVDLGFTDEATIGKVLASQLNLPFVELDQRAIDPAAAALIPAKLARHHVCIPISVERGQLLVAMANPLDLIALEDLEIATRRRVDPVIATPTAISGAIAQHYTAI